MKTFNKINIGSAPNTGDGDKLRDAFSKINDNYDNSYSKGEVDSKISKAVSDIAIPSKTSDLINDGDGQFPFLTKDNIPTPSLTIDEVLTNGNTTNQSIKFGTNDSNYLTINPNDYDFISMKDPLDQNGYAIRVSKGGLVQTSSEFRVKASGEGSVSLGTPSSGVITVYNTAGNRYTRLMAIQPTSNAAITLPNKSGTIALLSDVPSMSGFVSEAPITGKQYGRKDGSWVEIISSAPDPGTQNLQLIGVSGYKLLTSTVNAITFGAGSLFFGTKTVTTSAKMGDRSTAFGSNCWATSPNSLVGGSGCTVPSALHINSAAWGQNCTVNHSQAFAFGSNLLSPASESTVVGMYNSISGSASNALFVVGSGTGSLSRNNALEVLRTGVVLAPDCSNSEIESEPTGQALTTRQWVESKVVDPSSLIALLESSTPEQVASIKSLLGL